MRVWSDRMARGAAVAALTLLAACTAQPAAPDADAGADRVDAARPDTLGDGASDAPAQDVPVGPSACAPACAANAYCDDEAAPARCACRADFQDLDHDGACEPTCAAAQLTCPAGQLCSDRAGHARCEAAARPPIYITFLWHMHQPVYWPYEPVTDTIAAHRYSYDLGAIFGDRTGAYTTWPRDAIAAGRELSGLGAQVSLSGSLIENLENLRRAGAGFAGWSAPWSEAAGWTTTDGHPRLDLVAFPYHHPVLPLIDPRDAALQLRLQARVFQRVLGRAPGRGIFPAECAFSERIVPVLAGAGLAWSLVDSVHFERARADYPFTPASNLPPPNGAEAVNRTPTQWVQLQNIWAPSRVAAPWAYQPHWVQGRDPATGARARIIAVPAARYEGNEDARGGFGALQYEAVFAQLEAANTDPAHPILVVLHHDGDNYGGGTEGYYHGNFAAFVAWAGAQRARFVPTTVEDYLARFPPDPDDVIHVEDGSWSGADNGDPQFGKWNGPPGTDGYSPDRNSWAVIVAARNRVYTADALAPMASLDAVLDGTGSDTERAWHHLLNAEASDYWYWDGAEGGTWDSHPTRGCNLAVAAADRVLGAAPDDRVAPSLHPPQREPYNPGVNNAPTDVQIWTLAYDVSGLARVTLHYRVDADGTRDASNDRYEGGAWQTLAMSPDPLPAARTTPPPTVRAERYAATIAGLRDALVDYFVDAEDRGGRVARSTLEHVRIGAASLPTATPWSPAMPTRGDVVTITWPRAGMLHWGVDQGAGPWTLPPRSLWPAGTVAWPDNRAAETPLAGPDADGHYTARLGPFTGTTVTAVQFVVHYADNTWSTPDQSFTLR